MVENEAERPARNTDARRRETVEHRRRLLDVLRRYIHTGNSTEDVDFEDGVLYQARLEGVEELFPWISPAEGNRAIFAQHSRALNELDHLLDSHEVPYIVTRGLAMSQYYRFPEHRASSDIDLIVPEWALPVARVALPSAGYQQGTIDDRGKLHPLSIRDRERERHEKRLHAFIKFDRTSARATVVEIHHSVIPPYFGLNSDTESLLVERKRRTLPDQSVEYWAPSHSALMLELLVHTYLKLTSLPAIRARTDILLRRILDICLVARHSASAIERGIGLAPQDLKPLLNAALQVVDQLVLTSFSQGLTPAEARFSSQDVYYFSRGGHTRVGICDVSTITRYLAGGGAQFIEWLIDPDCLDETVVQHPHHL